MAKELSDLKIIDPRFKPEQWISASKKRLLLAAYIDYLCIGSLWAFVQFILLSFMPDINDLPPMGKLMMFGIYELLIFKFNIPSVGAILLSIKKFKYQAFDRAGKTVTGYVRFVNSWIKSNESWFSMIIALLYLSNGTKSIVRWMMWNPPMPFFGIQPSESTSILIYLLIGVIEISISFFLFKLTWKALYIGIPYLALTTISTLMSWNIWDSFVAEMVVRRRTYQGLPVQHERIQFFQAIVPEAFIVIFTLMLMALIMIFLKFRKIKRLPVQSSINHSFW